MFFCEQTGANFSIQNICSFVPKPTRLPINPMSLIDNLFGLKTSSSSFHVDRIFRDLFDVNVMLMLIYWEKSNKNLKIIHFIHFIRKPRMTEIRVNEKNRANIRFISVQSLFNSLHVISNRINVE